MDRNRPRPHLKQSRVWSWQAVRSQERGLGICLYREKQEEKSCPVCAPCHAPIQAQDGASSGHRNICDFLSPAFAQQLFLGHGNSSMQTRVPTIVKGQTWMVPRCAREGFWEKVAAGVTSYTPGSGRQTMPRASKADTRLPQGEGNSC